MLERLRHTNDLLVNPVCDRAEFRWFRYLNLLLKKPELLTQREFKQKTILFPDEAGNPRSCYTLQKPSGFGETTLFCLTGEYAGALALDLRVHKRDAAAWDLDTVKVHPRVQATPLRFIRATIDDFLSFEEQHPLHKEYILPYLFLETSSDSAWMATIFIDILTRLHVPLDADRMAANIRIAGVETAKT